MSADYATPLAIFNLDPPRLLIEPLAMDLFERAAGRPVAPSDEVTLEGHVERVVYSGGNGEFTVLRLQVAGEAQLVTVVGALLGVPVGARLRVRGRREVNPRFGPQVRVLHYTEIAPETVEGIKRYLGSGLVKGIGPELAARIVAKFGDRTLEILNGSAYRLSEVPGIGRQRADAIRTAWTAQQEISKVMVFLQGHGVSPAFAARIYKRYGAAAIARVRENPYRLAFDVWGIGFLSADRLAMALGLRKDADARVDAGVRHTLDEAAGGGHVFVPRERLTAAAAARLEVDEGLVRAAIDRLAREGEVAIESTGEVEAVFETGLHRAERAAAVELMRLCDAPVPSLTVDVDRALAAYEREAGLTLARQQAEALRLVLRTPVAVITGGPGVGKTTIVRGVVRILSQLGLRVVLAAPTGRAAKRMTEATGMNAATLHRLLEWRPRESAFGRSAENPLDADVLVVDEASMVDVRLAADLFTALPSGCRLILVGDVDQLPSVGPGAVLADVIASGRVPTARLSEIFRQAAQSLIVTNAHRILEGELPESAPAPAAGEPDGRDFFFIEEEDPARAAQLIRDLVSARLPRRYGYSAHDVQILAPMRRGELGTDNLNHLLQEALTTGRDELRRGTRLFRVGDRVMQLRNDYDKEVWNGDVGRIESIDREAGEALVSFEDRQVTYDGDALDELALAYAATVHKSQGSEYPAVVIPVHTQHFVMLQRNLLYTAVTRGKRLVVLVGTRKALGLAVRNRDVATRATRLADRLRRTGD